MATADQFVWDIADIDTTDLTRFGGKGTGLARMAAQGLPVPPAFVIGTDAYRAYRDGGGGLPDGLTEQVNAAIGRLEKAAWKSFAGSEGTPLLVSVRSGAKVSMPGMMDTLLNLGMDANSVARLATISNDIAFAVDSWARFWGMYADIVLGLDSLLLEDETEGPRKEAAEKGTPEALKAFEDAVIASIQNQGEEAPTEPRAQLDHAISAVFDSWDSPRAKTYRKHHEIPDDLGTAVTVQAMVFGNLNQNSGSGVAFTRNPITGVHELYGEYLRGGQGEEVVAGTTTPDPISDPETMGKALTDELTGFGSALEDLYRDALDIEFTVEDGKLYMLQVRPAKRTAEAAVSIATQLVSDKVISEGEGLQRVTVDQVKRLLRPKFDPDVLEKAVRLAKGIGASPGHASGAAVLDSDRAAERAATGEDVILLRPTTSPLDVRGMLTSQGIVTGRGGSASHAAVVSRALDKPCVVGCSDIDIDPDAKIFKINDRKFSEGDPLSIDGKTGNVYSGVIPLRKTDVKGGALAHLLDWADRAANANVWIEASNSAEAGSAASRKSVGIGVVPLTDLLVSTSAIDGFVDGVGALSNDGSAPSDKVEKCFEEAAYKACRALFEAAAGTPVDIRLPNLASAKSRRLISGWPSLAPHLLLPLGAPRLVETFLRAIGEAAKDSGHKQVTALISGITDVGELRAFRGIAGRVSDLRTGAVLQNPTVLHSTAELLSEDPVLWIDLYELVRATHGYPEEILFADEVLEEYVAAGHLSHHPKATLDPLSRGLVQDLLAAVGKRPACRVGIDLGGAPGLSVAADLYDIGFRDFTCPIDHYEGIRLLLGQTAGGSDK